MSLVEIDGSLLEGGGQLLRMSLAISTLCSIPIRVFNIRAGRTKGGLKAQHLKGVQLMKEITGGNVKGDYMGSTEIEFWPGHIKGGRYKADTGTAGSVGLLLQVSLPCLYYAESPISLNLRGGTNAEMAPQLDYTTEVFRRVLEKFGVTFDFELTRRGYFPRGGGEINIFTQPAKGFNAVTMLDQGQITAIYGWSFVAGTLPLRMAHVMADSAARLIKKDYPNVNLNFERYKENPDIASDNCSGIILVAETSTGCILGGSALGRRNYTPEQCGTDAAIELLTSLKDGSCVDPYTQDQVIIFMALADGKSQIKTGKVTLHTETAIYIAEKLTKAKFEVISNGPNSIISCDGIGLKNEKI